MRSAALFVLRLLAAGNIYIYIVLLLRGYLTASSASGHYAEPGFRGLWPCPFYGAHLPDNEPHTGVSAGPSLS